LLVVGGFKESIKLRDYRSPVMDQWISEQSMLQKHIGDAKKIVINKQATSTFGPINGNSAPTACRFYVHS